MAEIDFHHKSPLADRLFLIWLAAMAVGIPALIAAIHLFGWGSGAEGIYRWFFGGVFLALTTVTAFVNAYLCWIRGWLYQRRHGNVKELSHVSGLPVAGSLTALIAALVLPANWIVGILLLGLMLVDTGGIPWAAFLLLRESRRMSP